MVGEHAWELQETLEDPKLQFSEERVFFAFTCESRNELSWFSSPVFKKLSTTHYDRNNHGVFTSI
jgi:hypothetical protein